MKVTQITPVHAANLVANSGNTAYGVDVIVVTVWASSRAVVCQTCETHISVTARQIFSIRSSVELSRPVVVHCHGHLPICPIWAAIVFVLGPRETIFHETNPSLPANAGWNTCCAVVSHARRSIDTSIVSQSRVQLIQCQCKLQLQIANLGINNAF